MTGAPLSTLMAEVVAHGTERRLGFWVLREDAFFRRVPPERYAEAIAFALGAGQTAADTAIAQYGRQPEAMAAAMQVSVKHSEEAPRAGKAILFSEYGDRPPAVILYDPSMAEVNELIRENHLAELLGVNDVAPVHLAHELYHHLDAKKQIPGTAGFRVPTLTLGPIRMTTGLPSLAEIAADRFASAVLRLRVPPKAFQFITIYRYNPDYAWKLLDEIKAFPV